MAVRGRIQTFPPPPEVDYNHPDYDAPRSVCSTHVEIDGNETVYIYAENNTDIPPNKFHAYCQKIQEEFTEAMPGMTIIVGALDLKFTVISKKQELKAKLDGTLSENDT